MSEQPAGQTGHYFRIKGHKAEEVLHELAARTFLSDWCFPNPKLPTGRELCDLLVVFDSTAIIWQAKSLKLRRDGTLRQSEIEKNLRQLSGARRQLFDLKTPLVLQNPRRVLERFDPDGIEEIFLISVFLGESPDFQSFVKNLKEQQCHVFTRRFTETVLNELDTIADFCAYLREKERIRKHVGSFILLGDETELLGYYLLNDRSFAELEGNTAVFIDEGQWNELQRRPEYQAKRKADEISYIWDELVNRAHTGDSPQYEKIARELARPSRFERRCLSKFYYDAHMKAHKNASPNGIFRRTSLTEHGTYCFLFAGDDISREHRRALLDTLCFIARGKLPQHQKVLGIATEMMIRRESSLDYCLRDIPEWGPEQEQEMKRLQLETGTFTDATQHKVSMVEYPDIGEGGM